MTLIFRLTHISYRWIAMWPGKYLHLFFRWLLTTLLTLLFLFPSFLDWLSLLTLSCPAISQLFLLLNQSHIFTQHKEIFYNLDFGHCVYHRNKKQGRPLRLQSLLSVVRWYINFLSALEEHGQKNILERWLLDYIRLYYLYNPNIDVYKLERLRT